MEKFAVFLLSAFVLLALVPSDSQVQALYLPSNKLQIIKRSAAAAAAASHMKLASTRQKRYTDYQERASAFCTGLCMYEERKSYSDCFDSCNYYWDDADYKEPATATTKSHSASKQNDYEDSYYEDYVLPGESKSKPTESITKETYPFNTYTHSEKVSKAPASKNNDLYQSSNVNVQQPLNLRVGGANYQPEATLHEESELSKRFEILEHVKDRTEFADRLMDWHEEEHNMRMRVLQAQMQTETQHQQVIQMEHDNEELRRATLLIRFSNNDTTDDDTKKKGKGKGKNKNE